jgi:hypothetical protein
MYKTCTTTAQAVVDTAYGKEDNFFVNGVITYEVSITRDFGYYGSRSDDGPPDPDDVVIESVVSYNLWISNHKTESEGTEFDSNDDVQILDEAFLLGLVDVEELEVEFDDD